MNQKFYSDLRQIVLDAKSRQKQLDAARRVNGGGNVLAKHNLDRPRILQPHSDNGITGPTS